MRCYQAKCATVSAVINGAISYLATDELGSATVALDGSGNATASTLYDPYGQARYTTGAMPGSRGYTGQHTDSTTGLDYYQARYYDAVAGQFVSADSVQDGLNRYAYVHGNPETFTDPSGHKPIYCDPGDPACTGGSGGDGGGGTGGTGGCTSNCKPVCHINCDHKGGHKDTGSGQTSCRTDENQDGCKDWRIWRDHAEGIRTTALTNIRAEAGGYLLAAIGADILLVIVDLISKNALGAVVSTVITVLDLALDALGDLTYIFPDQEATLRSLQNGLATLLGAANALMALISGGAAWIVWAISAAFDGLKFAVEGISSFFWSLVGTAVGSLVQMGAQFLAAQGYAEFGDAAAQDPKVLAIWQWCSNGECGTEPNGGMPEPHQP